MLLLAFRRRYDRRSGRFIPGRVVSRGADQSPLSCRYFGHGPRGLRWAASAKGASNRYRTEATNGTVVKPPKWPNGTVVKSPKPAIGTVVKTPESPNGTVVNPPKLAIGTDPRSEPMTRYVPDTFYPNLAAAFNAPGITGCRPPGLYRRKLRLNLRLRPTRPVRHVAGGELSRADQYPRLCNAVVLCPNGASPDAGSALATLIAVGPSVTLNKLIAKRLGQPGTRAIMPER
jgi:hypothetical protein